MTALKRVIQVIVLYTRDRENTVLEVPERKEGGDMNKMGKEFFSPSHQPRGIEEEHHKINPDESCASARLFYPAGVF